ncbi:MAG: hypothetical protein ACR2RV_17450 [Verrucomicrobiales bacterium]
MKVKKDTRGAMRISLAASAAIISLGMSSCSTTTGSFDSSRRGGAPIGERVVDTALTGVAIPMMAAGWLFLQPFAAADEAMSY